MDTSNPRVEAVDSSTSKIMMKSSLCKFPTEKKISCQPQETKYRSIHNRKICSERRCQRKSYCNMSSSSVFQPCNDSQKLKERSGWPDKWKVGKLLGGSPNKIVEKCDNLSSKDPFQFEESDHSLEPYCNNRALNPKMLCKDIILEILENIVNWEMETELDTIFEKVLGDLETVESQNEEITLKRIFDSVLEENEESAIPIITKKAKKSLDEIFAYVLKDENVAEKKNSVGTNNCVKCDETFSSKKNREIHMKYLHSIPKTCENCSVIFKDKLEFYLHLPCQFTCKCGKKFPIFYKFDRHRKRCHRSLQKVAQNEEKSEFHNVISYNCFVCNLCDLSTENVKKHIAEHHANLTMTESNRCESCDVDVYDLAQHVFEKHSQMRRLRKSYVKSNGGNLQCPSVFAVKSGPVVVETGGNLPPMFDVKSKPVEVGSDDILIDHQNEMFATHQFNEIELNTEINKTHASAESVLENQSLCLEISTNASRSSTSTPNNVDSESENWDDVDLEEYLVKETEEEKVKNLKLDILDKAIEDRMNASILQNQIFDSRMQFLKDSIKKKEMDRSLNRSRADSLMKIGLDEIESRALMSLSHIAEIEDNKIMTPRRKLYYGTAGEQQSLFFRQIWEPFTDDQFGWFHSII